MGPVSRVVVERTVRSPFSLALEDAAAFFRQATGEGAEVGLPLRDLVPTLGGRLHQPVRIEFERRLDEAEAGRAHDAFAVRWTAGTRFFPDFRGELRLRIISVDETLLTLQGEYLPPLGLLGTIFDALIGRRIAAATMRDLLDRLGGAIEAHAAALRASTAAPAGSGTTA